MSYYLWERCFKCGHRLRFASDGCPQCGADLSARKDPPKRWPEKCECQRCSEARARKMREGA